MIHLLIFPGPDATERFCRRAFTTARFPHQPLVKCAVVAEIPMTHVSQVSQSHLLDAEDPN
jgi:hypothetical protein